MADLARLLRHGDSECMTGALDEMVSDEALRAELLSAFTKLADWMRNDPGNPHDRQQQT
jgi:truncated hemoglobin YjbI